MTEHDVRDRVAELARSARHRRGDEWTGLVLGAALTAMALMAGLFYSFAVAVMTGLAKVDDRTFVLTMQRMNRAIQNPAFALSFAGTLVLTALAVVLQRRHGPGLAVRWIVAALVLYALVLAVTFGINIPLNDELDRRRPGPDSRHRPCPAPVRRTMGGRQHRARPAVHRGGRRAWPGPVPARTWHGRPDRRSQRREVIMSAARHQWSGARSEAASVLSAIAHRVPAMSLTCVAFNA